MDRVMRRLSSSSTVFYKRVFPLLWVALIVLFGAMMWLLPTRAGQPIWPQLLPLPCMFGVGFLVYRKLIADLLDEVWLDGDNLLLKNRRQQRRVALRDVMNINASTMTNPRRITVMLRTSSHFGRDLSFIPASTRGLFSAFKPDPIATELIERVDSLQSASR